MAEQLAVEVDVKNVTEHTAAAAAGQAHLFCLDILIFMRCCLGLGWKAGTRHSI